MKENKETTEADLRRRVLDEARTYYEGVFKNKKKFSPGDRIPYAGRVFDHEEIENVIEASLDFWLTSGRYTLDFERDLAKFLGRRYANLVNSGSSANLV